VFQLLTDMRAEESFEMGWFLRQAPHVQSASEGGDAPTWELLNSERHSNVTDHPSTNRPRPYPRLH
jgi:hypothetical protein